MTEGLVLDSNQTLTASYLADVKAKFPTLVAISRGLFGGATDANGAVPSPVEAPVTADEVAAIHAAGLAFLPYANNYDWGDMT